VVLRNDLRRGDPATIADIAVRANVGRGRRVWSSKEDR
jgi:hypothetical protein